ncbi:fibronectin type III domain-containing protein [Neobacillus niacini]|uniref:fibronectin type III domain-containing protein n=1 Tax=Neobacillus niacini TaxID=86668 RepID=UPI0021CAF09D|nr:fibronectin type III domain-containing protein [Neobacillus niacini]MCM3764152.1 fibronectin type III domain-containing protein [Neobacillus niacini]
MKKWIKVVALVLVFFMATGNFGAVSFANAASSGSVAAPVNLQVPRLAYDENSMTLVWEKPKEYSNIADFNIYMDGKKIGSALKDNSGPAKAYIDNFYKNIDKDNFHTKILIHNFKVKNLKPDTSYEFYVTSVTAAGIESQPSNKITAKTTMEPEVFNIVDFGAKADDHVKDTEAIQAAIDAATAGSKVLIPEGKFISGEIWLKSDITLQVDGHLQASLDANDYSQNFWVYDYSTDERSYSLINAHTYDYGSLKNIRIVGKGIIDGSGWKEDPANKTIDELGNQLPRLLAGSNSLVTGGVKVENGQMSPLNLASDKTYGILAAIQSYASQQKGMNAKSAYSTRSNLITVRGVDGMYYEGITQLNPAFHGIVNLHSKNIVVNGTVATTYDGNNADGFEFGDSQNIMVFNNFVDTGDDAINFAAGMGQAAAGEEPTGKAWIFDNYIREGHGGVVTGSHTGSWFQDFVVEDNIMYKTDVGLRAKTNTPMGGGAKNVLFRDNALEGIDGDAPFVFTSDYSDPNAAISYEPAKEISQFKDMEIKNVTVRNQGGSKKQAIMVKGNSDVGEVYHENITFTNVKFDNVFSANLDYAKDFKFNHVVFTNVKDNNGNPWRITNSTGIQFEGTTTSSVISEDAAQKPIWPVGSSVQAQSSADGKSVTLTWDPALDNKAVTGYTVYKNGEKVGSAYTTTGQTTFTVTGLTPATEYTFKVEATDATGNRTSNGPEMKVTTLGEADTTAPVLPQNPQIKQATTTIPASDTFSGKSVEVVYPGFTWGSVTWDAASDETGIAGYNVYANGKLNGFATSNKYTLTQLEPGTKYQVTVEAVDIAGNKTPYGSSVEIQTQVPYPIGAPSFKGDLTAKVEKDGTSVILSWTKATAVNQDVIGYRIYVNGQPIMPDGTKFTPINDSMTTKDTTFTVTGLEKGKDYTFKVEAVGQGTKYTIRERLSDVIPNGLEEMKTYRWSGFGPSATVSLVNKEDIPNKPEAEQPEARPTDANNGGIKEAAAAKNAIDNGKQSPNGEQLPHTAGQSYNILLIGSILLIIGAATLYMSKRKRA